MFVASGHIHAIEDDENNTTYAPNYQRRYFDEITELTNKYSRDDLYKEIASIQETIDDWRTEYGVDSRADLEATLTDESLSNEEVQERSRVLRHWERCEDNKRLLKQAIH